MDVLQELLELEALKRLKASYFYYLDTKAWESWLSLFTTDAILEWDVAVATRGGEPHTQRCVGVDEIDRRVVREYLDPSTVCTRATPRYSNSARRQKHTASGRWKTSSLGDRGTQTSMATAITVRPIERSMASGRSPRCT
jgi:hypothetical protein